MRPGYFDLTSPDQLPDIDADEITITLREEGIGETNATGNIWEGAFLVFYWGEKEICRVSAWFEYYTGYLRWGEILKEKYGERLIDFETRYTVDLGGDSSSAFDKVRKFRKSLSGKVNMSDSEFDFITKSGIFDRGDAFYWKAIEFAKERHAGQTRDDWKTPYFEHIVGTIEILQQCGKISDYLFTLAALHDILEDTATTKDEIYTLLRKHPSDDYIRTTRRLYDCDEIEAKRIYDRLNNGDCRDIISSVELLTRKCDQDHAQYLSAIFQNDDMREHYRYNGVAIVKLADRLHNLTTLQLCGSSSKVERYICDTEKFFMPWREKHKDGEILFDRIEKQLTVLKSKHGTT